jgi:hypothetical protein
VYHDATKPAEREAVQSRALMTEVIFTHESSDLAGKNNIHWQLIAVQRAKLK